MKALFLFIERLTAFYPTRLPVGAKVHERWASSIIRMAGKAIPDNASTRFALACMILHLGSTTDKKSKTFFVKQLRKAAANEVGHAIAQQYKEKQKQDAQISNV